MKPVTMYDITVLTRDKLTTHYRTDIMPDYVGNASILVKILYKSKGMECYSTDTFPMDAVECITVVPVEE